MFKGIETFEINLPSLNHSPDHSNARVPEQNQSVDLRVDPVTDPLVCSLDLINMRTRQGTTADGLGL